MWEEIDLSRHVKVGRRALTEKDIDALHQKAIRSVIDLRFDDEVDEGVLSPAQEAAKLAGRGIAYEQIPVPEEDIDEALLDRIGEALRAARKPVLVHSAGGKRAGMIALAHTCIEAGIPGEEMLEMGRNLDLVFGSPEQQHRLATYVDERQQRPNRDVRREQAARADESLNPLLTEEVNTLREEIKEEHHRRHELDRGEYFREVPAPARPPAPRSRVMPPSQPHDETPHHTGAPVASKPVGVQGVTAQPERVGRTTPHVVPRRPHLGTVKTFPVRRPTPVPVEPEPVATIRPVQGVTESKPAGEIVSIGTPIGLATAVAVVAAVLLLIDRRLLLPLLFGAGVIAGRAIILRGRNVPLPPELIAADRAEDREVAELERRVKRLAARA